MRIRAPPRARVLVSSPSALLALAGQLVRRAVLDLDRLSVLALRVRERIDQRADDFYVAVDRNAAEVAIDEQVVEARPIARDDGVRALDRPRLRVAVHEGRDLVVDAELDARLGGLGRESRLERSGQPARLELDLLGRRPERPGAPVGEDEHHGAKLLPVLGELVDRGRGRRRQAPPPHDAIALELLEPGGEDVRPTSVKVGVEVGVAKLAVLDELADDQQRPALADDVEGVRDRAVLVVALHDTRSVAPKLAVR